MGLSLFIGEIMKLLFDLYSLQSYGNVKFNGGAEYVKVVFKKVVTLLDEHTELVCTYKSCSELPEDIKEIVIKNKITLIDITSKSLSSVISDNNIDRAYVGIIQRFPELEVSEDVELIIVWHDVRSVELQMNIRSIVLESNLSSVSSFITLFIKLLLYPIYTLLRSRSAYKAYDNIVNLARRKNTKIFTVSKHTKHTILSLFSGIEQARIFVYWAPSTDINGLSTKPISSLENENFWLMLGFGRWEKNNSIIILALIKNKLFRSSNRKLVLVGSYKSTLAYRLFKSHKWIVFLDYAERETLEWLYENAEVFVFPTFSEGFGYPPIEAMKYGTPVLASATSSIVEVCGSAPLYMCPYNQVEVASRIDQLLSEVDLVSKQSLIERYEFAKSKQDGDLSEMVKMIIRK